MAQSSTSAAWLEQLQGLCALAVTARVTASDWQGNSWHRAHVLLVPEATWGGCYIGRSCAAWHAELFSVAVSICGANHKPKPEVLIPIGTLCNTALAAAHAMACRIS